MGEALTIFDFPDLLPQTIHEIIAAIGEEAADKLVKRYGGALLPVGKGKVMTERFAELIDTIGEQSARELCGFFCHEDIYIPICQKAEIAVRDYKITADFDRMTTQEKPLSATRAVEFLAPKYGVSNRMIWNILKKPLPPHR